MSLSSSLSVCLVFSASFRFPPLSSCPVPLNLIESIIKDSKSDSLTSFLGFQTFCLRFPFNIVLSFAFGLHLLFKCLRFTSFVFNIRPILFVFLCLFRPLSARLSVSLSVYMSLYMSLICLSLSVYPFLLIYVSVSVSVSIPGHCSPSFNSAVAWLL